MKTFDYKFTPSLLQAFQDFLDSEAIYEKYYGKNEDSGLTYQEFEDKQFRELIDKINRVPFESEAADRGTCLNEIADCIVMGVKSTRDDVEVRSIRSYEDMCWEFLGEDGKPTAHALWFDVIKQPCIYAKTGLYDFYFDTAFCKAVGAYFRDSLCQLYTEAPIETACGSVLLYGYPDYVRGNMVYDLKTTSKYEFGKYSKYWQQHVYPWTLIESGKCSDIAAFEFTAIQMSGGTKREPLLSGDMYPEVYMYNHERSTSLLRGICERFAGFLEANRSLIKDTKIFGGERNAA